MGFLKNKRLLAVETDGCALRAFVIEAGKGDVEVCASAISTASNFSTALGEAIFELRAKYGRIPRKGIILTTEMTPVCLELPVDPSRPMPEREMREMIRWEMEPYLAHSTFSRSIGAILRGRGHLSYEQSRHVLQELNQRQAKTRGVGIGTPPDQPRYGEMAVENGFVTKEQIDECLAMQENLRKVNGENVYGWSSTGAALPSGKYCWIACGLPKMMQRIWREAFARYSIKLTAIYPVSTSVTGVINGRAMRETLAVLNLQHGLVSGVRLSGERIESVRVYHTGDEPVTEKTCMDVAGTDVKSIWISGNAANLQSVVETIRSISAGSVDYAPVKVREGLPQAAPACVAAVGAARHALGMPGGEKIPAIPAEEASVKLGRRPVVRLAACVCALAAGLAATDVMLAFNLRSLKRESEARRELQGLEEEIRQVQGGVNDLEQRRDFLDSLSRRDEALTGLLGAAAQACSEEIALDRIRDDEDGRFEVSGWALSEQAVRKFALDLSGRLMRWDLVVSDVHVESRKGRLDLDGYGFRLKVVPGKQK